MACCRVFVSGRVQGVAFRYSTVREAERLGLAGWVRNLSDGRVETLLEGPAEDVDAMVTWLGHGPSAARVDGIQVHPEKPAGTKVFAPLPTAHA